jgi:hypothetical protein
LKSTVSSGVEHQSKGRPDNAVAIAFEYFELGARTRRSGADAGIELESMNGRSWDEDNAGKGTRSVPAV